MSHEKEAGDDDEDQRHFAEVVASFQAYERHSMLRVRQMRHDFGTLSEERRQMVPAFLKKVQAMQDAVQANQRVIDLFAQPERLFENQEMHQHREARSSVMPSEDNMHKARSTLRQFARDWSLAGADERAACYAPILRLAEEHHPPGDLNSKRALVPGCGMARLVWEFASRGYAAQGNEFSYHMLLASNFILNQCSKEHPVTLYPYCLQASNRFAIADQFQAVVFPDVSPGDGLPEGADFSMNAGEFMLIYSEQEHLEAWDIVAAPFFLDTAHDPIQYMQCIFNTLKPGGTWYNLGPLLYHYTDSPGEISIELSLEEIIHAAREIGFFVVEYPRIQTTYTGTDLTSMQGNVYNCAFFSATKPIS